MFILQRVDVGRFHLALLQGALPSERLVHRGRTAERHTITKFSSCEAGLNTYAIGKAGFALNCGHGQYHAAGRGHRGSSGNLYRNGKRKMTEDEMRKRLAVLKTEHRDLDAAIEALRATGSHDQLQIARLKKRKLSLKDQVVQLEDALLPDIIA